MYYATLVLFHCIVDIHTCTITVPHWRNVVKVNWIYTNVRITLPKQIYLYILKQLRAVIIYDTMQVESNNSPWFNPTQGKEVHFLNYCRFSPTLLTISTSNYLGMLYQTCLTMSFNCSTSAISTCQDIENIHTHYHSPWILQGQY